MRIMNFYHNNYKITLQAQMTVLKEEKKKLEKTVDDFNRSRSVKNIENSETQRSRSQSFSSEKQGKKLFNVHTRDMGTMCGVMTRDVGISHQQVIFFTVSGVLLLIIGG